MLLVQEPAVSSENYLVTGCGEKTDSVLSLLQEVWGGLHLALENAGHSIVYNKFFNGASPTLVGGILSSIATGANITRMGQQRRPTIMCATSDMPDIAQEWEVCATPFTQATAILGYEFIILCPTMLELKQWPNANDCVGALASDMYSNGQGLARTQATILLHELVNVYLATTPGFWPLKPQVYGLHAVLDLPATMSVINSANYVFYVASMTIRHKHPTKLEADTFLLVDIMARCTTINPPASLRPAERVLLNGSVTTNGAPSDISLLVQDSTPSPDCASNPLLAGFGDCPGVSASNSFTTVPTIVSGSLGGTDTPTSTSPTA